MEISRAGLRLSWGVQAGEPLEIGGGALTVRALHVRLRAAQWGAFWNYPIGVELRRGERVERLAVVDLTRVGLWLLGALTLVSGARAARALLQAEVSKGGIHG